MVDWVTEHCYTCKMAFAMPREFQQTMIQLAEKGTFYCPAGHSQHYVRGESELDKMRRERDRLKQDAARLHDRINNEREAREHAERQAAARKGQVTKMRKRAANGVCPCCNRSFANLRNHMATQHPQYAAEEVA